LLGDAPKQPDDNTHDGRSVRPYRGVGLVPPHEPTAVGAHLEPPQGRFSVNGHNYEVAFCRRDLPQKNDVALNDGRCGHAVPGNPKGEVRGGVEPRRGHGDRRIGSFRHASDDPTQ
jgi:hypothetical protein